MKTMTVEQIAKKYVYGVHDALTDQQEIKDMVTDIETYAKEYHQVKLKLLGIADVSNPIDDEIGEQLNEFSKIAGTKQPKKDSF